MIFYFIIIKKNQLKKKKNKKPKKVSINYKSKEIYKDKERENNLSKSA